MALNYGPVPAWNAPMSEKIALLVALGAVLICFDRVYPHRRPATTRDIITFIALRCSVGYDNRISRAVERTRVPAAQVKCRVPVVAPPTRRKTVKGTSGRRLAQ
jgi:hypothetical protein